jgi:hypothetical protein
MVRRRRKRSSEGRRLLNLKRDNLVQPPLRRTGRVHTAQLPLGAGTGCHLYRSWMLTEKSDAAPGPTASDSGPHIPTSAIALPCHEPRTQTCLRQPAAIFGIPHAEQTRSVCDMKDQWWGYAIAAEAEWGPLTRILEVGPTYRGFQRVGVDGRRSKWGSAIFAASCWVCDRVAPTCQYRARHCQTPCYRRQCLASGCTCSSTVPTLPADPALLVLAVTQTPSSAQTTRGFVTWQSRPGSGRGNRG